MAFFSRLFGSRPSVEKDNRGTRHDSRELASSHWFARVTAAKKDSFILSTFDRAEDAKAALLEVPCIRVAADSGKLICTEVLIFGVYPTEEGRFEAVLCGDELTVELWERARASFAKHGGRLKGEQKPEARTPKAAVSEAKGKVVFLREERHPQMGHTMTYRIHSAPNGAIAQTWLQANAVKKNHYYPSSRRRTATTAATSTGCTKSSHPPFGSNARAK